MIFGRKPIGTVAYLGGLPCVLQTFAWCWGQMVQHNQELLCNADSYVHLARSTFSDHGPARNSLVSSFLGDWLIQFDTDHEFEPDITRRLVDLANEMQIDVLSAVYQFKSLPYLPVLYQWIQLPDGKQGLQPMATWPRDARALQIGSAGGGCLFVRRKVFDRIVSELKEQPFDRRDGFSEDHSFFLRCRLLEIKCYAAMQVHSNHLRIAPVTLSDLDGIELPTSELFSVEGF